MNETVDSTAYLQNIASQVVDLAAKPKSLRAILLQGSVAKSIADVYSDIELKFIWADKTSPKDRATVFQSVPKEPLFAEEEEDGEWVSAFVYKSVKIDISHLEMPTLLPIIEGVMGSRDTSIAGQTLLASIQDSVALYGKDALDEINAQFADYPLELSTRCIQVNAPFGEWSMRSALLERKDMVALHHLIDLTLLQMLRLLYALNQMYLRSYNFKWFRYNSGMLSLKPRDFEDRVERLLNQSYQQSIPELDALLHEVFDLVTQHRPDIDVVTQKEALNYIRTPLDTVT